MFSCFDFFIYRFNFVTILLTTLTLDAIHIFSKQYMISDLKSKQYIIKKQIINNILLI
jgi:hypothetical protein